MSPPPVDAPLTPGECIGFFADASEWLAHFLEALLETPPQPPVVGDTLLQLYLEPPPRRTEVCVWGPHTHTRTFTPPSPKHSPHP